MPGGGVLWWQGGDGFLPSGIGGFGTKAPGNIEPLWSAGASD
jgi:hypothetical protein